MKLLALLFVGWAIVPTSIALWALVLGVRDYLRLRRERRAPRRPLTFY